MKIYLASLFQETNTFCPHPTDLDSVRRGLFLKGSEVRARLQGTNTEIGGVLESLDGNPAVEVIPGVVAWALSSGKITTAAFQALVAELLADLKRHSPVDGVLLVLHGALVSEDLDDCEGALLGKVRKAAGGKTPIVCTLDYHAVVTDEMLAHADLLIGYRTYPHVDLAETGRRAAQALVRLIVEQPRIERVYETLPVILPVENTETDAGPMAEITDQLRQLDVDPNVLSASCFCPHPWLDIADFHLSFLIYATSPQAAAYRDIALCMRKHVWDRRAEFFGNVPDLPTFVASADRYAKPTVLIDAGDIVSAGGGGDSTEVLRCMLANGAHLKTVLTLVDPATVDEAVRVGEGQTAEFNPGGEHGSNYNRRTRVKAQVRKISTAPLTFAGAAFGGLSIPIGRRVWLATDRAVDLVVTEYPCLTHDPSFLRSLGIQPEGYDVIVQKTHKLFRPAYQDIAKSIVMVDTPGFTDRNIKRLPYRKLRRPIYPLDEC